MPVLMIATYNEDGTVNVTASENVMTNGKLDMTLVNAIAFHTAHPSQPQAIRLNHLFQELQWQDEKTMNPVQHHANASLLMEC